MALKSYVFETAYNPGTGTFACLGAITGRKPFVPTFASGSTVMYFADDGTGTNWEEGYGTASTGSPNNTLTRTVLANSAGTTSPINFTGSVDIVCWIPSSLALYKHPSGYADLLGADLRNHLSMNGGAASGQRNRLVNPKMDIWQVATSYSTPASGSMVGDGYELVYDGTGSTFSVSRQAVGDLTMRSMGLRRFLRIDRTVAGSGGTFWQMKSKVESVYNFPGRQVVAGFWGRADSARSVAVKVAQNFGTGGSPSAEVYTTLGTVNLTSTWTWYQVSATLPAITGKTLGSNNDDYVALVLEFPLNVISLFEFSDMHFMEGSYLAYQSAEPCSPGEALRRCQRFRSPLPVGISGAAFSTSAVTLFGITPVPLRALPAVDWSGTGVVYFPGIASFNSTQAPTVQNYDSYSGGLVISWGGFSGLTSGAPCGFLTMPSRAMLTALLP